LAPLVTIQLPAGGGLASGSRQLSGTAMDPDGAGVARVEVRLGNGPWQSARGTRHWTAPVQVPASGRFAIAARAVDEAGLMSAPVLAELRVDNTPPTLRFDPLAALRGGQDAILSGTAQDAEGGAIARVEVRIEGRWRQVPGPYPPRDGDAVQWSLPWSYLGQEGATHRLVARAVDDAGNISPASPELAVQVDAVAPVSEIRQPPAGASRPSGSFVVWGYAEDGLGVERVEVSLNGGRSWRPALLGAEAAALAGVAVPPTPPAPPGPGRGPERLYLPVLASGRDPSGSTLWAIRVVAEPGPLAIRSRAIDRAGNVEALGPPLRLR
jgi:hypothetical protein